MDPSARAQFQAPIPSTVLSPELCPHRPCSRQGYCQAPPCYAVTVHPFPRAAINPEIDLARPILCPLPHPISPPTPLPSPLSESSLCFSFPSLKAPRPASLLDVIRVCALISLVVGRKSCRPVDVLVCRMRGPGQSSQGLTEAHTIELQGLRLVVGQKTGGRPGGRRRRPAGQIGARPGLPSCGRPGHTPPGSL